MNTLATLAEGDEVRILGVENPARELFETTFDLLEKPVDGSNSDDDATVGPSLHFVPQKPGVAGSFQAGRGAGLIHNAERLAGSFRPGRGNGHGKSEC